MRDAQPTARLPRTERGGKPGTDSEGPPLIHKSTERAPPAGPAKMESKQSPSTGRGAAGHKIPQPTATKSPRYWAESPQADADSNFMPKINKNTDHYLDNRKKRLEKEAQ